MVLISAAGILLQGVPAAWLPSAATGSALPAALHIKPTETGFPFTTWVAYGFTREIVFGWPNALSVKSPVRCATDGTRPVNEIPCRWYFCSKSPKKNVLFFLIGPPRAK